MIPTTSGSAATASSGLLRERHAGAVGVVVEHRGQPGLRRAPPARAARAPPGGQDVGRGGHHQPVGAALVGRAGPAPAPRGWRCRRPRAAPGTRPAMRRLDRLEHRAALVEVERVALARRARGDEAGDPAGEHELDQGAEPASARAPSSSNGVTSGTSTPGNVMGGDLPPPARTRSGGQPRRRTAAGVGASWTCPAWPHVRALTASSGDAAGFTEVSSRDLPGGGRELSACPCPRAPTHRRRPAAAPTTIAASCWIRVSRPTPSSPTRCAWRS